MVPRKAFYASIYRKNLIMYAHLLEKVRFVDTGTGRTRCGTPAYCPSILNGAFYASIYSKRCVLRGQDPKRDARVLSPEKGRHSDRDSWRRSAHLGLGFRVRVKGLR
jgi:hypothetical protein